MKIPMAMWKSPSEMSNIYVIECAGFIKVGIAGSIEGRLQQLRAMNPLECELRHTVQVCKHYARTVETRVHMALHKLGRTHRYEWFSATADEAIAEVERLKAWHDQIYAEHLLHVSSNEPPADFEKWARQTKAVSDLRFERSFRA